MMKLLAILLCIAIGSVFGELERRNFAKKKLETTEDDKEVSYLISLDEDDVGRNTADSLDESLRVKYTNGDSLDQIAFRAENADSVEQKISRNPSPVIETWTVKRSSSKATKKKLEKMRSEKAAKHFKELRKLTRRNSTAESQTVPVKKISANFLKRLLMSTDALGRKERVLAINSRKLLRRKRVVEVEDPNDLIGSIIAYEKIREKIPQQLRDKMRKTDLAEDDLVEGYVHSNGDMSNLVANYNAKKLAEREQLKLVATGSEATEVIGNYKAMRKGKPWNKEKLRGSLEGFFGKTSPSLTEYLNLKQDETASIDSFLGGSSNTGSEKKDTNEQSQEKEKPAEEKATQEQPQEKEQPAEEKATQEQLQEKEQPAEEKATQEQPQEKEQPAEEKATNEQPQEHDSQTDETDWLSNEPAEDDPVGVIPYRDTDEVRPDSDLNDKWIDDNANTDLENPEKSKPNYKEYRMYLNRELRFPIKYTDDCEYALLRKSEQDHKFRKAYLDLYYKYREKEIEALKEYLASRPENIKPRVLKVYKVIRNGKPRIYQKENFPVFFGADMPKAAVDKYLAVKKEELYTDQYLDGSLKIGHVPENYKPPAADAMERELRQRKSEKTRRKLLKTAELSRAEEEENMEKMEEMKRGLRAKETEAVAVEYDANRENVETDISDAKGDTEAHGRLGNATSADVTNTETTKDRKTKHDSSYFLRFLILFAMVMQAIIAVLILAPQKDKLAEWCKRRKKTEYGQAEKEPLQIGEKVFAVGRTSKSAKSPLNAARM